MTQHLFEKFYWIPVIIIWVLLLVKNRRILGFKFSLLKVDPRPGKEIYIPLLAIMAMLVTLALVVPLSYDEAFTFTQFTWPGPQQALCNYPAPNNHVFHSLLTTLTWRVFIFTHSELSVRLPALLFSAFTLYFVFTRYLEGKTVGVVLFSILYLFSPNIIEFAFQARGYSIQIFCAIASYYYATDNITTRNITFLKRLNIVLLISVMGLFTNPAYLYTASCVYLILITLNYREIKTGFASFAIINIFYGLTLLLLYTPIIASKGLHVIIANENVVPVGWFTFDKMLKHLNDLVNFLTLPRSMGWIVIALFLWNTIKRRSYYNVYFLVIPLILMVILKQLPFFRIFLPIGAILLVNACMALTSSKIIKKMMTTPLSFLQQIPALLLIAASCIISYVYFNDYHKKDDLAKAFLFKKIRSAIPGHNMVYTKNIGDYWDCTEILTATMRIHYGVENATEIDRDLKEYDLRSAVILSTEPVGNFKIVDSVKGFEGGNKSILIIEPGK